MATAIARRGVVVGAGIAGLTAARALADWFEEVVVLERDTLGYDGRDRAGIPQGKHVHVLLAGGLRALEELFPGFGQRLVQRGAVPLRVGLDLRVDRPGYDPFPQRDLGWNDYWMSRAQIEWTVRDSVRTMKNVEIREGCRVEAFIPDGAGPTIARVRWTDAAGVTQSIDSDIAVDASSQGRLTLRLLESIGAPPPEETTIGVDLGYSTAIFAIPDHAPRDCKGVYCLPSAPKSSRGALLAPIEDRRWILTVGGHRHERPPRDVDGFHAFVQSLRTSTIHRAVKDARQLGDIAHFRFPESCLRHYERLERFPRGLLAIGDAICRFNPVYGQGMSVAAQEAVALQQLFATRRGETDPLGGLAATFFAQCRALIETPWANAAIPDLTYPETRGQRPDDFEQRLKFSAAFAELCARDPEVHKLSAEVQHLLKPRSVYRDRQLVERVRAVMAEGR